MFETAQPKEKGMRFLLGRAESMASSWVVATRSGAVGDGVGDGGGGGQGSSYRKHET